MRDRLGWFGLVRLVLRRVFTDVTDWLVGLRLCGVCLDHWVSCFAGFGSLVVLTFL